MSELPPCGLYRTTRPLPGSEEGVAADRLVYFHNHSDAGPPRVVLPADNVHNRWSFAEPGVTLDDAEYCASLVALKPEGLWRLSEHLHTDADHVVAKHSLVQLGYTRAGEAILFFPRAAEGVNGLVFPPRGTKVADTVTALLEPVDIRGPRRLRRLH